jgi:hypothetical protein
MNSFEFFKNYKGFAAYVRHRTSAVLLDKLEKSKDSLERKALMLRIIEELASITEDLSMWIITVVNRSDGDKRYRDEWERLLKLEINKDDEKKVLANLTRLRTTKGFLKKLNLPPLEKISQELNSDKNIVEDALEKVKSSIEMVIKQRKERSGLLLLVQNKLKHGMMVYTDSDPNNILIRIFMVKNIKSGKRIFRRNRMVEIPVDVPKAKLMVGSIKAYGQAIEALINLLLIDYKYKILSKEIKMRTPKKEKCLNAINNALGRN